MIQNSVFYKDRIYQSQQLTVKISKESRNNCSFLEIEQKTFSSVFFLIKVNWTQISLDTRNKSINRKTLQLKRALRVQSSSQTQETYHMVVLTINIQKQKQHTNTLKKQLKGSTHAARMTNHMTTQAVGFSSLKAVVQRTSVELARASCETPGSSALLT